MIGPTNSGGRLSPNETGERLVPGWMSDYINDVVLVEEAPVAPEKAPATAVPPAEAKPSAAAKPTAAAKPSAPAPVKVKRVNRNSR